MINSLFIYTQRGDLIVNKIFKDSIRKSSSLAEVFRVQVILSGIGSKNINGGSKKYENEGQYDNSRSPILTLGSTTFHHIYKNNMWFVTVSKNNVDSGLIWEYLYKIHSMMVNVYGITNDGLLKENFWTVYELVDGTISTNGVPYDTDIYSINTKVYSHILEFENIDMVSLASNSLNKMNISNKNKKNINSARSRGSAISNNNNNSSTVFGMNPDIQNVPWRRNENIKYKKNEIVFNILESINLLISKDGEILKNTIDGKINVDCQLSGMPSISFQVLSSYLNETNMKFHECVNLSNFSFKDDGNERNKTIDFIPPDGKFELLTYHLSENSNIPFSVVASVTKNSKSIYANNKNKNKTKYKNENDVEENDEFKGSREQEYHYDIKIKSLFSDKIYAHDVYLYVPLLDSTTNCDTESSGGQTKLISSNENNKIVEWKINKFKGSSEHSIRLTASVAGTGVAAGLNMSNKDREKYGSSEIETNAKHLPISLKFQLSTYSSSGLAIKNCNIFEKQYSKNNNNYKVDRWIKYETTAGNYEFRY